MTNLGNHNAPKRPRSAETATWPVPRDVTVAFGAGHGALLPPVQRRIEKCLPCNFFTFIGAVDKIHLRATTQDELHTETMRIAALCNVVLQDVRGTIIMKWFLQNCSMVVSLVVKDTNVTLIGYAFLSFLSLPVLDISRPDGCHGDWIASSGTAGSPRAQRGNQFFSQPPPAPELRIWKVVTVPGVSQEEVVLWCGNVLQRYACARLGSFLGSLSRN